MLPPRLHSLRRGLVTALLLAGGSAALADILHLRDGSRYYGTLVRRDEQRVVFQITLSGESSVEQSFPAELVKNIELGARPPPAAAGAGAASGVPNEPDEDAVATLVGALELARAGQLSAALRSIQALVDRASPATLAELERTCQARAGHPLDEWLAQTRVEAALRESRGRTFRLRYVTRYERAALGRLLRQMQDERLARVYAGRSVAEWGLAPADYQTIQPDSRQLVADASLTAAFIQVRLRHDPVLATDAATERSKLSAQRERLVRLAAQVRSLRGYTAPPSESPDDPTLQAAERLERARQATSRPAVSRPTSARANRPEPRNPSMEERAP